jgi:tetratricopeptide (TPR) repeat protein
MDFTKLIAQAEANLRLGHGGQNLALLSALDLADIPRSFRLALADICRRSSLANLGLKIMAPIIFQTEPLGQPVTAGELAGHAALLQRIGSIGEAGQILRRVDSKAAPEALLYQAFCLFTQWRYDEAVPVLRTYIASPIATYWKLVGRVNLASALVCTQLWEEAHAELTLLIETAEQSGAKRLLANCYEMRAQAYVKQRKFTEASEDLSAATGLLGLDQTSDQLFVMKWKAVLAAIISGDCEPLLRFRTEAETRNHGETLRETDLYLCKLREDDRRFNLLYFGTPYRAYRARIEAEIGRKPNNSSFSLGAPEGKLLDLTQGTLLRSTKAGGSIHRVLDLFYRDFYQPVRLGGIFAELFPEENFNIYTSPNRVHQVLRRARRALEKAGLPLKILETDGCYRAQPSSDCRVLVPLERVPLETNRKRLSDLAAAFGERTFATRDVCRVLSLSDATSNRLLRWGVDNHFLSCTGRGPATKYKRIA